MRSVCFFTDPDVRAQWSELRRLNTEAQTLANSWTIDVVRGAMIKDPRKAEPHLFVLEQNGITQFTVSDYLARRARGVFDDVLAAFRGLVLLQVTNANVAPTSPGEKARVSVAAGTGGAGTSDLLNIAVEDRAAEEGNRKKLAAASGATCRHIFVPVDSAAGVVWNLVRHGPPSQPPKLPPEVDMAWIIGSGGSVLYVEPPGDWQSAEIDPTIWDKQDPWRANQF